jgi:hypothetical protein
LLLRSSVRVADNPYGAKSQTQELQCGHFKDEGMAAHMRFGGVLKLVAAVLMVIGCNLLPGCRSAQTHGSSAQTDIGPTAAVQVSLKAHSLPEGFFKPGADTECSSQIIGYRFIVWLDSQNVAVGFNTSPNCRSAPDLHVSGALRVLVFDSSGAIKASRILSYPADGYGELVADGEAMPGPNGTLLIRIQSVNLDKEGRHESKSGVLLLDSQLNDVAQLDGFLEQTTLIDHALVFQNGVVFSGPRTYSILNGPAATDTTHQQVDWPVGAMDRKFGDTGSRSCTADKNSILASTPQQT